MTMENDYVEKSSKQFTQQLSSKSSVLILITRNPLPPNKIASEELAFCLTARVLASSMVELTDSSQVKVDVMPPSTSPRPISDDDVDDAPVSLLPGLSRAVEEVERRERAERQRGAGQVGEWTWLP